MKRRGRLVTFEGIEGSGKSTQISLLAERIRSTGREPVLVREPGGTELGEAIRAVLLAPAEEGIEANAELLLYLAARAQLVARRIAPELDRGAIVLADRFGDASVAYQGGGRGLGLDRVRRLVGFATFGLTPDRTYLLDLPAAAGLSRVRARGRRLDRMEGEGIGFHERVRRAYRAIAAAEPDRVRRLKATDPPETIAARIWRDLRPRLESRGAETSRRRRKE